VRISREPDQATGAVSLENISHGSDEIFQNISGMRPQAGMIDRTLHTRFKVLDGRIVTTVMLGEFRTIKMCHGLYNRSPFSRLPFEFVVWMRFGMTIALNLG
jgi:hypothetical protein